MKRIEEWELIVSNGDHAHACITKGRVSSLWSSSTAKASQGGGKGLLISRDKTFTLSGLRQHLLVYEDDRISDSVSEGACTGRE